MKITSMKVFALCLAANFLVGVAIGAGFETGRAMTKKSKNK